jgi:2-keto-4-pentenoate hydratase/2-oxohepta-3-ene-1,7-dioic acid hydratase in catechol pathway
MRLVNFETAETGVAAGVLIDGSVVDLGTLLPVRVGGRLVDDLLRQGPDALSELRHAVHSRVADGDDLLRVEDVRLRPPVLNPPRIFALAANFAEHVTESGGVPSEKSGRLPLVFSKLPSSLIGDGDEIVLPGDSDTVDWEIELAAVVGSSARNVPTEQARSVVAGYAVFNDLSARTMDYAERTAPGNATTEWFDFLNGKWFDTSAVLGPWLTTADEVPDPLALQMRLDVNGVRRQDAVSGEMIFGIDESVAFISRWTTLLPGDVIALGTPAGCGFPTGTYLRPGDRVRAEIEGLGVLENRVVGSR